MPRTPCLDFPPSLPLTTIPPRTSPPTSGSLSSKPSRLANPVSLTSSPLCNPTWSSTMSSSRPFRLLRSSHDVLPPPLRPRRPPLSAASKRVPARRGSPPRLRHQLPSLVRGCPASLEGKYINYISSVSQKRILPVGPLVADGGEGKDSEIMRRLDGKEEKSTVYASTSCRMKRLAVEIAKGLERISYGWLGLRRWNWRREKWCRGWAPQASILGHSSVAAFVSHCGWSSFNESIYYGVPVVGMPVKVNMFVDARMLVEAGACVEVLREGGGGFEGEEITKAIYMVVRRGEGLRRRA